GCGFGHFVRWACEHGWDAWGYEPDPWARERTEARGRVVATMDELSPPFALITLWDVLEHITEPIDYAHSLLPWLSPGGRLLVSSPNFAAMKLRWPLLRRSPERFNAVLKPFEHVVQFTEIGIRLTL